MATKYEVSYTNQFQKDLDKLTKQGKNLDKLFAVIDKLANKQVLDKAYRDHKLVGEYDGYRECHIEFDWILIY